MRRAPMLVVAGCIALAGCGGGGGSGSNDQGASFRALGIFQEEEKVAPEPDVFDFENPRGDTGRIISLAATDVIPNDTNGDGDLDGGYIGLQNNLESQSLNVQGVTV